MAKKPNYAFERNAKAKAKAEKREAKRQAKVATKSEDSAVETTAELGDDALSTDITADDAV
jgi:hypothetical protein